MKSLLGERRHITCIETKCKNVFNLMRTIVVHDWGADRQSFGPEIGKRVDEYGLRDLVIGPSVAIRNVPLWFYTRTYSMLILA